MYAIIKTGGKQYRVSPGETLRVEKLDGAELKGRNLRVSEARDRAPRPPMGGGGGGFMDDGPPSMDFGRKPAKPKGSRRGLRGRKRGF